MTGTITYSAGIAESKEMDETSSSLEALIDLADKRLYLAKNEGRNRVLA